jgi:hypothetical protein
LLTDGEIRRSWTKLLVTNEHNNETFDKAERLLEELQPENPLRHRLAAELRELRMRHAPRRN